MEWSAWSHVYLMRKGGVMKTATRGVMTGDRGGGSGCWMDWMDGDETQGWTGRNHVYLKMSLEPCIDSTTRQGLVMNEFVGACSIIYHVKITTVRTFRSAAFRLKVASGFSALHTSCCCHDGWGGICSHVTYVCMAVSLP